MVRFLAKTVVVFLAILTGLQMLGEWWKPAKDLREYVLSDTAILPITFVGFFALHLTLECFLYKQRKELDALRPKQRWSTVTSGRRKKKPAAGRRR